MKPLLQRSLMFGIGLAAFWGMTQSALAGYQTCYEQEYKCHTEYQQECHNENQCYTVPGQNECRQVRACTPRPSQPNCQDVTECGTNALGQQICKTRQVCNGSTVGEDCGYVNECHQGPSHQECTTQQRCEQVPRNVCGYETVQKTCYVPDPPAPPPPQPAPQPAPQPPPYYPDPTPAPAPQPAPQPPPYYPDPTPAPAPSPSPSPEDPSIPEELGPQSISKLKMMIFNDQSVVVVFDDQGQAEDYDTQYSLTVREALTGKVVLKAQRVAGNGQVSRRITLNVKLPPQTHYILTLSVKRSGEALGEDVIFKKEFDRH